MSYIVPRDKPKECYKCPFMDRITYDCKLMYSNDYPDFEVHIPVLTVYPIPHIFH